MIDLSKPLKQDLHVHTLYCDGKSTPEEIVKAALSLGLERIGFSGHSHLPFTNDYPMPHPSVCHYRDDIAALKEKYRGQIEILCGVEMDYYSDETVSDYDYAIGSVHHLKVGDYYTSVDHASDVFIRETETYFGGDYYSVSECYFETVADVINKTNADIIGHFDVVAKFNEQDHHFDEQNPRYVAAWKAAVDSLLPYGVPFEINTGGISRGYKTTPYPAKPIIDYIKHRGGRFVLTSDSHSADTLCYGFSEFEYLLK